MTTELSAGRFEGQRRGATLSDNRQGAVLQRTLEDNRRNSWTKVIQRVEIPVVVTGLTHLVEPKGGSIFEGEEIAEVTHGDEIVIENSDKIRSRRGPNQEYNRAGDLQGAAVYRWVRVVTLNGNPLRRHAYIRDDAFESGHPSPLGERPSRIAPDQRDRSGAIPSQDVHLVGTTHSSSAQYDKSERIASGTLDNSDLIVEHPTPIGRNRTQIDPSVQDITQSNLIARAGRNRQVIGGDGRKLLLPGDGSGAGLHALSIRSQPQEITLAPHANTAHISLLAHQFVNACLGIGGQDVNAIIQRIVAIGTYRSTRLGRNTPDVAAVLQNGYRRVSTITKYFKPEVKASLASKVLAVFQSDLHAAQDEIRGEIEGLENHYADKTNGDYLRALADYQTQMANSAVSPFHDAISNLTLFSETLANNGANLTVAFGAEHVAPLNELLGEVSGIHKNYSTFDHTR